MNAIEIEINWNRLTASVNEAASTLMRTAFSGIVRDNRDFACGLFSRDGELLAQDTLGTPGLAGPMPKAMPYFMSNYPEAVLLPGDVLFTNDPWQITGHLNDITMVSPIWLDGEIVAYAMSIAHQTDIGGRGMTLESRDVFEEGLRIPLCKLLEAGELNRDALMFVRENVRVPNMVLGDIRAQLAANDTIVRHTLSMIDTIGPSEFVEFGRDILSRTELATRTALGELAPGVYKAELQLDSDFGLKRESMEPFWLKATITVASESLTIDYAGTSKQAPFAINSCLNGLTTSYTLFALKSILNPHLPMNSGFIRPLRFDAPQGTLLNPTFPAPVRGRNQVAHFLPELIYQAFSESIPEKVIAPSGTVPSWNQQFTGIGNDGLPYSQVFPIRGGMGASARQDGLSCITFPHNVQNLPVEILEQDVPVVVDEKQFLPDSAGIGTRQGGFGQRFVVRVPTEPGLRPKNPVFVGMQGGRFEHEIPGIFGGGSAPRGCVKFNGKPTRTGRMLSLQAGDRLEYEVPGGGGYGDPKRRPRHLVEADILNDLVTLDRAEEAYLTSRTTAPAAD